MRHHNNIRKFGRSKNQRNALLKGLALSLIAHGKIETTEAKAKELRPFIEKLVTKANVGTLASRRIVIGRLYNLTKEATKLIDEIAPKYKDRDGGYTRIIKIKERIGDDALEVRLELV